MHTHADLLLGIDVGTTNCKALVFDQAGQLHAAGSVPTPATYPQPGWVEYDPAALWSAVVLVVRAALAQIDPARICGVAVASMAEAGLLVGSAGEPLHPIIGWDDSRSDGYYRAWRARFGADQFYPITGNRPNPVFGLFKLLWLREHAPEAYAAAARWLHVSDYIALRLCGVQATDYSLATRTMLLDLPRLRWSAEMIDAAGLRTNLLPELVASGTRLGGVLPAAAAATGLPAGIAVGCGGHDHSCGALAAGVYASSVALDSMGTAEVAFLPLAGLPLEPAAPGPVCSFGAHVVPGVGYAARGIRSSGSAVAWAAQALGAGADRDRLQAAAAGAPVGSCGVFFLPHLAPIDRGGFAGLTAAAGPAELARAVYEGLAYEWRRNLELIERAAGVRAEQIRVIGGGSRDGLWLQIKADVLGRPLHVLEQAESVALGAALLGGMAAGVYRDAADAAERVERPYHLAWPEPARADWYAGAYSSVYLQLAELFGRLGPAIDALPPTA